MVITGSGKIIITIVNIFLKDMNKADHQIWATRLRGHLGLWEYNCHWISRWKKLCFQNRCLNRHFEADCFHKNHPLIGVLRRLGPFVNRQYFDARPFRGGFTRIGNCVFSAILFSWPFILYQVYNVIDGLERYGFYMLWNTCRNKFLGGKGPYNASLVGNSFTYMS